MAKYRGELADRPRVGLGQLLERLERRCVSELVQSA